MVLFTVILPILFIFSLGYIGQKLIKLDIKSVSTTALYLMTPFLVFRSFYENKVDSTYVYILIYGVFLSLIIICLVKGLGRLVGFSNSLTSALILSTAFMNNGNFGSPIILLAFGQKAFQYAVTIMVLHTIIMSTLGIYYAARGQSDLKSAFLSVVKMPIVHAVFLSIIWKYLNLPMPSNLYKVINMVADAAIPTIMLVLGMQLAEIKLVKIELNKISFALFIRLIISPTIAYVITLLLPVDPLLARVMITEAAMPSAAITTMYALQFNSMPELVSSITLISTLVSLGTLSILLTYVH